MAEVLELNDLDSLASHQLEWAALWGATPEASFFQTYDWLRIYCDHFGQGQRLRVLVVRAAGQTIGIVPLMVRSTQHSLARIRKLCYPLDDWGTVFGPIGPNPAATLHMAMRHVAQTPRDWDEIELRWVAHGTTDRGRTFGALQRVGLTPRLLPDQTSSLIDLEGSWEAYLATRKRKARQEITRQLRKVEGLPGVEFVRHRPGAFREGDGDAAWDLYQQCEEVARASWQANVKEGNTLSHPGVCDFYRDAHAAAARLGMVDLSLVRVDGRPSAFLYSYHHQGRVLGLRMGYDPSVPFPGLGTGLLLWTLRDGFARGDKWFDFGAGDEAYKQPLRTRSVETSRLTHVPRGGWKPQIVRAARWLRRRSHLPSASHAV